MRAKKNVSRKTKYSNFGVCSTNTGFFTSCRCCVCCTESDIAGELGVGVSLYFKQLKNLVIILFLCTMFSMPAYLLFWSGEVINNPYTPEAGQGLSFNGYLASLSLANLGEKSSRNLKLSLKKTLGAQKLDFATQQVDMFCDSGTMAVVRRHGIALPKKKSENASFLAYSYCPISPGSVNQLTFI